MTLMSGSSYIRILIGAEYQNGRKTLDFYLLFAIWMGANSIKTDLRIFNLSTGQFVQENLCQKLSFVHQLTHNMTTDCSLNYNFNT